MFKFCVEKLPIWLQNFLVPLDSYLEYDTGKCDSFFHLKNNKICGSLDKSLLEDMNGVKDLGN